jgi:hypothetical protein
LGKSFWENTFGEKVIWGKVAFAIFWESHFGEKSLGEKSFGEKLFGETLFGEKSFGEKSFGEKSFGEKSFWGKDKEPRNKLSYFFPDEAETSQALYRGDNVMINFIC